jgi:2-hydroxy-3-oxopropionate reductase
LDAQDDQVRLQRVGFIGLGVMGRPMATNLLRAGYPVIVHSRSPGPVEQLARRGAGIGDTPARVAASADVLILMVPNTTDVFDCLNGVDGILAGLVPEAVVVDMGTHDPAAMPKVASAIRRRGGSFLDAPVSGGEMSAQQGTLSIMVGGPRRILGEVQAVLASMGTTVTHVGSVGAGQVAKACSQLVVASTIEAVAEALVLAVAAGVDPAKVREAMLGGFAQSRILEEHGQRMLAREFTPGARAELHAKDAHIVLELARRLGVKTPGFVPVAEQLDTLTRTGSGGLDHSALLTLVESRSAR